MLENLFGRRDSEQAFHRSFTHDPISTLHASSPEDARRVYTKSLGFQVAPAADPLCLELARSGLVCLQIPMASWLELAPDSDVLRGIKAHVGYRRDGVGRASCETTVLQSADTRWAILLFSAPEGKPVEVRQHRIPVNSDGVPGETVERVDHDSSHPEQDNRLPLPHAGTPEKVLCLHAPAPWPSELNALLIDDKNTATDDSVGEWIDTHYVRDNSAKTTRAEVWQAFLAAHNYVPSQYSENRFGRAASRWSGELHSKKAASHTYWLIKRRDPNVALGKIPGVDAEKIDPVEFAEFKRWRISQELSPVRRAERKAQNDAIATALRHEIDLKARFGSQAVLDSLNEKQDGESFFQVFGKCEPARQQACAAAGKKYRALDLLSAKAAWWTATGKPGVDHYARFASLIAQFGEGKP